MIDKLCKNVIDHLIVNNHLQSDDQELYMYSLRLLICSIINVIATIIIGLLMQMLSQSICMFASFFLLRKFAGGLHAEKYQNCFFSSVIINVISLFLIRFLESTNYILAFIIILCCSFIIISILSPVENINKPLSDKEKHIYKYVSIILGLVIGIISSVLLFNNILFGFSLGLGMIIVSILLTVDKFTKVFRNS